MYLYLPAILSVATRSIHLRLQTHSRFGKQDAGLQGAISSSQEALQESTPVAIFAGLTTELATGVAYCRDQLIGPDCLARSLVSGGCPSYHKSFPGPSPRETNRTHSAHAPTIHLRNARRLQGLRREGRAARYQPVVLLRRQDRRGRRKRVGQVHPAADHGRHRQGLRRHGHSGQGHAGPLRGPGAAAGPRQDRPRKPALGHEADPGPGRPLQRDHRPHGRSRSRTTTSTS